MDPVPGRRRFPLVPSLEQWQRVGEYAIHMVWQWGHLSGGCMRLARKWYVSYIVLCLTTGSLEMGGLSRRTFRRPIRKFLFLDRTFTGESEGCGQFGRPPDRHD